MAAGDIQHVTATGEWVHRGSDGVLHHDAAASPGCCTCSNCCNFTPPPASVSVALSGVNDACTSGGFGSEQRVFGNWNQTFYLPQTATCTWSATISTCFIITANSCGTGTESGRNLVLTVTKAQNTITVNVTAGGLGVFSGTYNHGSPLDCTDTTPRAASNTYTTSGTGSNIGKDGTATVTMGATGANPTTGLSATTSSFSLSFSGVTAFTNSCCNAPNDGAGDYVKVFSGSMGSYTVSHGVRTDISGFTFRFYSDASCTTDHASFGDRTCRVTITRTNCRTFLINADCVGTNGNTGNPGMIFCGKIVQNPTDGSFVVSNQMSAPGTCPAATSPANDCCGSCTHMAGGGTCTVTPL